MENNIFEKFINKYQVSKTLRFELIPQGNTLENIKKNGILDEDEHRAESYKIVKEIIDRYHKAFIEDTLSEFYLQGLDVYYDYYTRIRKTEEEIKAFEECQANRLVEGSCSYRSDR